MQKPLLAPLFVPADRADRYEKAAGSGTDAVIVDLEDAVPPERKNSARSLASAAAQLATPVIVRINAENTPWHDADVAFLRAHPSLGAMIPKGENPDAIDRIARVLGERVVIVLVESALGIRHCWEIAEIKGVTQLAFGPADLARDLGCPASSPTLACARSTLVIASAAASIPPPIDGPTFDVRSASLTTSDAATARELGFGGKLCIHPSQIAPVRHAFAPTASEIAWARKIIHAQNNLGAVLVDGVMIDKPIIEAALRTVERAEEIAA